MAPASTSGAGLPGVSRHSHRRGCGCRRVTPSWYSRPLRVGDQGDDVRAVQLLLRAEPTGYYDEATARRVRGYRSLRGLPVRGDVDDRLASTLGELQ